MNNRQRALLAGISVSIVALLYFQALVDKRSCGRRVGIVVQEADGGLLVTNVAPGSPAATGGFAPGDLLLRLAGTPVTGQLEYNRVAAHFQPGAEVVFQVRREGRQMELQVRPGVPFPWINFLVAAAAALGHLALGLLALLQWSADFRARLLALLALAVAVELALPPGVVGAPALTVALVASFFLLTGIQFSIELHLASVIPTRRAWLSRRPWVVVLYYVVGLGIGVAGFAILLAAASGYRLSWVSPGDVRRFLNQVLLPVWALAVVLLLAHPALRHPEPVGRHQAALVLLGVLPWAVLTLATTGLQLAGRPVPFWIDPAQSLAILCYPVAVFVAIFHYHLFDLERVVRRGLMYTTLTGALLLLFYTALGVGGALLSDLLSEGGSVWVVGAATLVLGLLFNPLRRATQQLIDRRLFPERDAMRRRLVALSGELPAKVKLPAMGHHLVESLREIFGLSSATLLLAHSEAGPLVTLAARGLGRDPRRGPPALFPLDDPAIDRIRKAGKPLSLRHLGRRGGVVARRLARFGADLAVPVTHQGELVAVLLLGGKVDGRSFPADEVELLDLFSHHLAAVLENARLFESATLDPLTGLRRRESILETLEAEFDRARRHGRPLAVGMADLDHFKEVNDLHGHLVGDLMLKRVSQALRSGLRGADAIGRYGGEEFLLVLPETDLAGGLAVAEKLRLAVEAVEVETEEGETVRTTISIGLASLGHPAAAETSTPQTLLAAADRGLYRAKHSGRNRVSSSLAAAG
jgi:diguanylate cyclase (GGDEF)-like protein